MKKTYAILASIAALVLAVYALLPKTYFEEVLFPLSENVSVTPYDDIADGGDSKVEFSANQESVNFQCKLGADTTKSAWCGLIWNMKPQDQLVYRNWTFVDTLVFDVEAQGTREVLLKLWAYDPDVTDEKKPRTFRLLMKEMPLRQGRQRVAIPIDHLYTPEFWFETANADLSLTRRHLESIARLEIAPGWNQARGAEFSVKFYGVVARGVSNVAFGVVLVIFLILTIIAVGFRHQQKNDVQKK